MGCFYCVSPTGVNYYEYRNRLHLNAVFSFRPQQGLTIMNTLYDILMMTEQDEFPSPTGVNYYELNILKSYTCNL